MHIARCRCPLPLCDPPDVISFCWTRPFHTVCPRAGSRAGPAGFREIPVSRDGPGISRGHPGTQSCPCAPHSRHHHQQECECGSVNAKRNQSKCRTKRSDTFRSEMLKMSRLTMLVTPPPLPSTTGGPPTLRSLPKLVPGNTPARSLHRSVQEAAQPVSQAQAEGGVTFSRSTRGNREVTERDIRGISLSVSRVSSAGTHWCRTSNGRSNIPWRLSHRISSPGSGNRTTTYVVTQAPCDSTSRTTQNRARSTSPDGVPPRGASPGCTLHRVWAPVWDVDCRNQIPGTVSTTQHLSGF